MGLFFNRQEFTLGLDAKIQEFNDKLQQMESQQISTIEKVAIFEELTRHLNHVVNEIQFRIPMMIQDELKKIIQNEVAKQIQSAKAVEKAHEKHPSLEKRMTKKRTRRVGTYAEKQYNEPFRIAWTMKNNGHSRAQIADALNARGFTTPHSNIFTVKVVTDLMHNQYQKKQMEYEKAKQAKQIAIQTDSQRNFLNGIM
jgi:hypothetical protein